MSLIQIHIFKYTNSVISAHSAWSNSKTVMCISVFGYTWDKQGRTLNLLENSDKHLSNFYSMSRQRIPAPAVLYY